MLYVVLNIPSCFSQCAIEDVTVASEALQWEGMSIVEMSQWHLKSTLFPEYANSTAAKWAYHYTVRRNGGFSNAEALSAKFRECLTW